MNELQSIDKLTTEILILKQQAAFNIIEIGKRLITAKESLNHGEWGKWLEEKVNFSNVTATRFMRVASEFSNVSALKDLSSTKIFALLDLPENQRENFIKENNVSEMSTRQLQQAIKEKKEAEKKIKDLEEERFSLRKMLNEKPKEKIVEKEVIKKIIPDDYKSLKAKVHEYEEKEKLNKKEAAEYEKLKNQIEQLKDTKDDFDRKFKSITELSNSVAKIEEFIKTYLAPLKYSHALQEQRNDEIVQKNLKETVDRVQNWCDEMYPLFNKKFVEVNLNE